MNSVPIPRRTVFFMALPGLSGCWRDSRPRLNVFNWSGYIAPDTVPLFERTFNVRVRYSVFESNEEMLARVMSGNSGWDVVFPTSYLIEPMRQMHLLSPLDHRRLGNLHHLDGQFRNPPWDRDLRWGVPYMWNATGICYSEKLDFDVEAWEDLWSPELQGHVTMLDDPVDVFAACLKKLGHSINTRNPDHLRAAQKEAIEQKELLRAYINAEVRDQLVAGDVTASQLWSTTAQQAIDSSEHLVFVFPSEGFPIYPDVSVVLRESPRKELAHEFINFLLDPKIAASNVVHARTATANGSARALLPEDLQDSPTLYPADDVLARGEWAEPATPEVQRLRDRLWTEIKSA